MTYPGYKPVKILDTFAKIAGRQVYHHNGRDVYSIERDHSYLVAMTPEEVIHLAGQFELETCVRDAQDARDDVSKNVARTVVGGGR